MQGDWYFPVRTLVGAGRRHEIRELLNHVCSTPRSISLDPDASQGNSEIRRPLVVTDPLVASLPWFSEFVGVIESGSGGEDKWDVQVYSGVHGNPLESDVMEAAELYRKYNCDSVVCVGGGSGLDAGKCVAMIAESGFETLNHPALDCLHDGPEVGAIPSTGLNQLNRPNRLIPCVAVATTAGTGAEMDSAAMYTNETIGEKRCAGHRDLPLAVILDAETTLTLPENITAWTGMDALVHALEALLVPDLYSPLCDGSALQALEKIDCNLRSAVVCAREWRDKGMKMKELNNMADQTKDYLHHLIVRQEMLVGSALAAVGFQRGLGAVHSLSEPVGAVFNTHHGLTNAILLPHFLKDLEQQFSEANKHITRPYGQDPGSLKAEWDYKMNTIARLLRLSERASTPSSNPVTLVIDWVDQLCSDLEIPEMLSSILKPDQIQNLNIPVLAAKSERNQTGFGNAIRYTAEDYERVISKVIKT